MGSLPEGKVKVRLEHDGTVLEVDEDDVEKVGGVIVIIMWHYSSKSQETCLITLICLSVCLPGKSSIIWSSGGSLLSPVPQRVQHPSHPSSALWWKPHSHLRWAKSSGDQSSQHPCLVLREGTNFTQSLKITSNLRQREMEWYGLFISGDADV